MVPGMSEPVSHFTHVVRAGRLVFVSGCVATDGAGRVVGGNDIVAQTRQVHENIKRCLSAAGATFADICKVTVFLRNINDREKVNTVRKEYFGAPHGRAMKRAMAPGEFSRGEKEMVAAVVSGVNACHY